MITSYRLIIFQPNLPNSAAYEIPLCYISKFDCQTPFIGKDKMTICLNDTHLYPPYIVEIYTQIYKQNLSPLPTYYSPITIEFENKNIKIFEKKLMDSIFARHWEEKIQKQKEEFKPISMGFTGYKLHYEQEAMNNQIAISYGLADLDSLKVSAKKLVDISEKIRAKFADKKIDAIPQEIQELQSVMFDVGIGTPVNRQNSGSSFLKELSRQFGDFMTV